MSTVFGWNYVHMLTTQILKLKKKGTCDCDDKCLEKHLILLKPNVNQRINVFSM